ncbi:MAG: hypothetical protein A2148_12415 [Chloroflexi bacterium RBG_16_68_14]|nr:MAG: hypothetical protein A2148_12415 [Chloroflexi bacterium RBG_16_68_14]
MRNLFLALGLALLLLGGVLGLAATGLLLAWEEVPPPGADGPFSAGEASVVKLANIHGSGWAEQHT